MTSPTTTPSIRRSAARPPSTGWPRRWPRMASASSSTSSPITWASRATRNPWWLDVLENGPSSPRAAFFDIDWHPVKRELPDKVLLPVLPDQYGRVLEARQLGVELSEGAFFVRHAGARLPLSPDTYPQILAHRLDAARGAARRRARGAGRAAQHPHRARPPARPDGDGSGADRGAPAREGDRQAAARRPRQGVAGDPRARRRQSSGSLNGTEGRSRELRPPRPAPVRADVPARRLARRGRRGQLPPLLRREQPRRAADGGAGGLRRRAPARPAPRRRGQGRPACGSIIPTGSTRPSNTSGGSRKARSCRPRGASCPTSARATSRRSPRTTAPRSRPTRRRRRRGRSGSSPRRSSCPASPCPSGGPWRARRATTSWARSTGSSSIAAPRGAWRRSTGASRARARAWPTRPMRPSASSCRSRWRARSTSSAIAWTGSPSETASSATSRCRAWRARCARSSPPFPSIAPTWARTAGEPSARDRAYIEHAVASAERRNPTVNVSVFDFVRDALLLRYPRGGRCRGAGGAAPLRHALPADHRPRHGQGRRGHRALSLQPARVAERGGQRSRPLRRAHRGLSRQERPPPGALARHAPGHVDP